MSFMDWSEDYETGIEDIDNDHKALFMFVNDLHDKVHTDAGKTAITETLAGLANYVNVHFAREEKFMIEADYPDIEEHIEAHRRLSGRVFALTDQYKQDSANFDTTAFMEFMKGWLTGHILYTDMDYVPAMQEAVQQALSETGSK